MIKDKIKDAYLRVLGEIDAELSVSELSDNVILLESGLD